MKRHKNGTYKPGVVYELCAVNPIDGEKETFYVGESHQPDVRLKQHKSKGKNADEESTLVYNYISELDTVGIEWCMQELCAYGKEGPTDLEDEWIVNKILADCRLKNMKKGNANWMSNMQEASKDMQKRNITSYRAYKEVLTLEEKEAKAEKLKEKVEEEERQQRAYEHKQQLYLPNAMQAKERRDALMERLDAENAERRLAKATKKKRKPALGKDEARLARIKADTEKLMAEEEARNANNTI
jgi:hypothetical protein